METKEIELYGVAERIMFYTNWANGKGTWILRLITDETEWLVIVPEENDHYGLEDGEGAHLYVSGFEIAEGVFTAKHIDQWGRICSHCGKHHEEGFWIHEHEYACSDECAIAILGGKEAFDEAMNEYDDDANYNPICWVEWYN